MPCLFPLNIQSSLRNYSLAKSQQVQMVVDQHWQLSREAGFGLSRAESTEWRSPLESYVVDTMVFRGQEALSVPMFALAKYTVTEAKVSLLHLPLLEGAPFSTVQGKVKSLILLFIQQIKHPVCPTHCSNCWGCTREQNQVPSPLFSMSFSGGDKLCA